MSSQLKREVKEVKRFLLALLFGLTLIGSVLSTGALADTNPPPPPPPITGPGGH
jgi:hypothetical protein